MATITPEQRQAIEKAGGQPVRVDDPENRTQYVLIKAELYDRMKSLLDAEPADRSLHGLDEFHPSEAYRAVDRTFAEGWDDPKMDDYDRYEQHRP